MIFEGVDSDKCFIHITLLVSFNAVLLILAISRAVSTHICINIALHVCNDLFPEAVTFLRFVFPGVTSQCFQIKRHLCRTVVKKCIAMQTDSFFFKI